jgi:tryptophanyl-tRNA synthetase
MAAGAAGSEEGAGTAGVTGMAAMPESVVNLFLLLRLVADSDVVSKFEADYAAGTIRYGDMKKELAEGMVAFISPIREKAEAIRNDLPYLRRVMEQGADKARASAQETMKLAREAIGLNYY